MSTNSNIRIKRKDGTQTGIYCHWDGYIENNGVILQLAYNTPEKVEELLKLGDLSSLGFVTKPYEGAVHDFDHSQENVCVAYHRDRGEEFHQHLQDAEFIYIFDEAECVWYVVTEIFNKKTSGVDLLDLGYVIEKKKTLLIDEIMNRSELIDGSRYWLDTGKYAEKGEAVLACIHKAKEARAEIIRKRNEERNEYYRAYCD